MIKPWFDVSRPSRKLGLVGSKLARLVMRFSQGASPEHHYVDRGLFVSLFIIIIHFLSKYDNMIS